MQRRRFEQVLTPETLGFYPDRAKNGSRAKGARRQ